ncbi:hypothetical protein AB0M45_32340 [Nocardia sp. NPDC051787]
MTIPSPAGKRAFDRHHELCGPAHAGPVVPESGAMPGTEPGEKPIGQPLR